MSALLLATGSVVRLWTGNPGRLQSTGDVWRWPVSFAATLARSALGSPDEDDNAVSLVDHSGNGQYSPSDSLPSGCQMVEYTVQPAGTNQSWVVLPVTGVPFVTVCGVLVVAHPLQRSKLRVCFHSQ